MKDLLVYTADADAMAAVRALLARPGALGIRAVSSEVRSFPLHDAGIVNQGPELARTLKGQFERALLMWDHHGSGREGRLAPDAAAAAVQERLNTCTWRDASAAIVLVPELEEWLWHDPDTLGRHLGVDPVTLSEWEAAFALQQRREKDRTADHVRRHAPKELFEHVCLKRLHRTISPRDFERIAAAASLSRWGQSESFARLREVLRAWFPPA